MSDSENDIAGQEVINDKKGQRKSVAIQTEVVQRDLIPLKILRLYDQEQERFPKFLYQSHTLTGLSIIFVTMIVLYQVYSRDETLKYYYPQTFTYQAQLGLKAAIFTFLIYGIIYSPNTYLSRPHPAFWRMIHVFGLVYMFVLAFANMFSREELQKFFTTVVDPNLGVPLKERSYAEDCRIYIPEHSIHPFYNIISAVDIFALAHVVGWTFKMLIMRDFKLSMIQSITFEFLEITFRHWLPNFWECWWDHIILDLILCNTGGILIGWWIIKKFRMKEYRWSLKTQQSQVSWFTNFKQIFNPTLEDHHWKVFSSTKRFLQVIFFLITGQIIDLNFFFIKYVIWLEPNNFMCSLRTFLMGFLAMPATREYYEYISNKNVTRLGAYAWNVFGIIGLEAILFFNNYNNQFQKPFPAYVVWSWIIIAVFFLITLAILIYRDIRKYIEKRKNRKLKKTQ